MHFQFVANAVGSSSPLLLRGIGTVWSWYQSFGLLDLQQRGVCMRT